MDWFVTLVTVWFQGVLLATLLIVSSAIMITITLLEIVLFVLIL